MVNASDSRLTSGEPTVIQPSLGGVSQLTRGWVPLGPPHSVQVAGSSFERGRVFATQIPGSGGLITIRYRTPGRKQQTIVESTPSSTLGAVSHVAGRAHGQTSQITGRTDNLDRGAVGLFGVGRDLTHRGV